MTQTGPDGQPFVWVTRPRPQAETHAAALAKAGMRPLLSPVMTIRPVPAPDAAPLLPSRTAGLIFTSVNGLLHFPDRWRADFVNHPVFVSGSTTQSLAMEMGFQDVSCSPDQGGRGIIPLLRDRLPPAKGTNPLNLLYIAGTSRTPLLETELTADYQLTLIELYAADFARQLSDTARQAFQNRQVAATTLFSGRTAANAAELLRNNFKTDAEPIMRDLLAVCISQAVADRAMQCGFTQTAIAQAESADSIVKKLVEQLKIHRNSPKTI